MEVRRRAARVQVWGYGVLEFRCCCVDTEAFASTESFASKLRSFGSVLHACRFASRVLESRCQRAHMEAFASQAPELPRCAELVQIWRYLPQECWRSAAGAHTQKYLPQEGWRRMLEMPEVMRCVRDVEAWRYVDMVFLRRAASILTRRYRCMAL